MASTPRRSPRLAMKRTRLEAEMESPTCTCTCTIRKVRACFEEAEKQLFSPIQECLTSLTSSSCSFSRSHIQRRRMHVGSKNSNRRSDR